MAGTPDLFDVDARIRRLRDLNDLSISQTLARSLCMSATALLAMLPIALWGGNAVQGFVILMVFGIVVATSSSVFIAAPTLPFLGDWRKQRAGGDAGFAGSFTS